MEHFQHVASLLSRNFSPAVDTSGKPGVRGVFSWLAAGAVVFAIVKCFGPLAVRYVVIVLSSWTASTFASGGYQSVRACRAEFARRFSFGRSVSACGASYTISLGIVVHRVGSTVGQVLSVGAPSAISCVPVLAVSPRWTNRGAGVRKFVRHAYNAASYING